MTTNKNIDDETLRRLKRLEQAAARGSQNADKATEDPNAGAAIGIREALYGLSWLGKAFHRAAQMGQFVWDNVGKPVWRFMEPAVGGIYRFYRDNIWPMAYTTNAEGEKVFSPKKAGVVLTATFMAAAMLVPTANLAYEGMMMGTTMRTQTVYLHTVNDHNDGSYSIKGCDNLTQCETKDSAYYNVDTSIARHLWSLFNKGSLFVPRRLVGTVAPDGNNRCEIKVYGAYYEKFMQNFENYPELLDITCVRVDNQGNPIGPAVTPATAPAIQQQAPAGP